MGSNRTGSVGCGRSKGPAADTRAAHFLWCHTWRGLFLPHETSVPDFAWLHPDSTEKLFTSPKNHRTTLLSELFSHVTILCHLPLSLSNGICHSFFLIFIFIYLFLVQFFRFKQWTTLSVIVQVGQWENTPYTHSYNLWHSLDRDTPDGTRAGWSKVHPTFLRKTHTSSHFSPSKRRLRNTAGKKPKERLQCHSWLYELNIFIWLQMIFVLVSASSRDTCSHLSLTGASRIRRRFCLLGALFWANSWAEWLASVESNWPVGVGEACRHRKKEGWQGAVEVKVCVCVCLGGGGGFGGRGGPTLQI